jgi:clan AA aspartic protease
MTSPRRSAYWTAIAIRNGEGEFVEVDVVIDTGFDGSLTLPPDLISTLKLTWRSKGAALMANGQINQCDIYATTAQWDGASRNVLVEAVESEPLVGTALMRGYELRVEFLPDGVVTLRAIQR